jgi:hypothetical protein
MLQAVADLHRLSLEFFPDDDAYDASQASVTFS